MALNVSNGLFFEGFHQVLHYFSFDWQCFLFEIKTVDQLGHFFSFWVEGLKENVFDDFVLFVNDIGEHVSI